MVLGGAWGEAMRVVLFDVPGQVTGVIAMGAVTFGAAYYDQQGVLTRRLGIAQVPALVSQEGKRLRVDELEVTP